MTAVILENPSHPKELWITDADGSICCRTNKIVNKPLKHSADGFLPSELSRRRDDSLIADKAEFSGQHGHILTRRFRVRVQFGAFLWSP